MAYTDPVKQPTDDTEDPNAIPGAPKKPTPVGANINVAPTTPSIVPPASTKDPMAFAATDPSGSAPSNLPVLQGAQTAATNPVPTNTPTLGAPPPIGTQAPLDPAAVQQYKATQSAVLPAGSGDSNTDWDAALRAEIARSAPGQAQAADPNYHPLSTAEVGALSPEQQIAQGYLRPGDPNNKGFGGIVGQDPTGGAPSRTLQGGLETDANGLPVPGGYNAQTDAAVQLKAAGMAGMNVNPDGTWSGAPKPGAASIEQALAGPAGGAAVGGAKTNTPTLGGGSSPASGAPSGGSDPYRTGMTTTDPNNSLLGKTLLAGPETDRFKIAGDKFKTWQEQNDPYFQAKLRQASQQAAGRGQLYSGMARGTLGDIGQQYALEGRGAGQNFLQNALEGSIGDAYKNVGLAQQQQGFQANQQQNAFQQEYMRTQLDEALKNGDFQRYYQLLQAGNQGNPSDTALALSGITGNQATGAGNAVGQYYGSQGYAKGNK